MKVLQINTVCGETSTGKKAYDMHTWLKKSGHESAVAYGRGSLTGDKDTWRFSPVWEVYAHAMLTRLTGWTGCFSPIATNRLLQYIEKYAPDIVHLRNIHGYYVDAYRLLSYLKEKDIRTIITMHDEWLYTGKCGYTYECNKWRAECCKCPRINDYPASLFFDQTKAMFREKKRLFEAFEHLTFVAPTQWLADKARQSFLRNKQIKVITNGIDTEIFHPNDTSTLTSIYGSTKSIVHITPNFKDGRKGGQYVLELARRMPNVLFYIVGNKKPINGLPGNVRALGYTKNQYQLAQWYSFADVTLITSKMDNLPTVCLESLCCGTPVAGFNTGGTAETAPDGYGLFVPYPDVDKLEAAVCRALNGELRSSEDCAEFGRKNYAKEVMAQKYLELYEEEFAKRGVNT